MTDTMIECRFCERLLPADPPNPDPLTDEMRFGICDACARKATVPGETGLHWARTRLLTFPDLAERIERR